MSQDDEYEYEERASSPLERKSAMDRSEKFPLSVKKTQWKPAKDDMEMSIDMSLDVPTQMDIDEEEEDLPPPRLDRKSTRLNSSHRIASRMPSSA